MKSFCALLLGLCLLGVSHPTAAYETRGARSCAGWQEFRQDEQTGYALTAQIYETWMVGYLSGLVAGSGVDFLVGTDNAAVFLMVDTYCNENRRMNLAAAGTYVAKSLLQQKGIIYMGTRP